MWGIQYQMRNLVPQEKSELTKEDRLQSQGLKKFLSRNGFDVKPEMVSSLVGLAMLSALSMALCHKIYLMCFALRNLYFYRPMFGIQAFIEKFAF
jgi:hypothetical protein